PGNAAPRGQCRVFRRREETQRDLTNGAAGATARRARRDRFRAGYRCAENRRRWRQSSTRTRSLVCRDYALPAAPQLHCSGCRARALARPHRAHWRQGARHGTRGAGLRPVPGGGAGVNAEVAVVNVAAESTLAQVYGPARGRLPDDEANAARRDAAFEVFAKQGLPHRRIEEWKYTDLRGLMREAKPLASPPDAAAKARAKNAGRMLGDLDARRLVFVDGAFVDELSDLRDLEAGLVVTSLAQAHAAGDPILAARLAKLAPASDVAVALNTALMGDGAVIHIAAGATIERPLHLLFVVSDKPAATFTRSLIIIDHGARVMLIESHEGPSGSDYQVNAALELFAGDGAHVDHVKVVGEGAKALPFSTLAAAIGRHARFNTFSFMAGGSVVRNQLFLKFDGEGTVAAIRGAALLRASQHADTTVVAEHIARDCQSREMFKS